LNGRQEALLLLRSMAVTLLLGAALDASHRAAAGRRLHAAGAAVVASPVAMLPLPFLFVYGLEPGVFGKAAGQEIFAGPSRRGRG
jgi:hypothetical protein